MAANKSVRKSQLIAFDNVAAGHDGVLSDPSGELVVKPCKQSEIDFYESASAHPEILPHIPTYLGTITLGSSAATAQVAGALVLPSETHPDPPSVSEIGSTAVISNDWAPSSGNNIQTDLAIALNNVAHGYKKPNILDVKLGARLWADDASAEKRVRLDKVAASTTSGSLGFRIAGMKVFEGSSGDGPGVSRVNGYKVFDKNYGRSFTADNVDEGFGDYFLLDKEERATGPIRKVIRRFIDNLKEMQEVIEKAESRMYSASLLFVYEGDRQTLQDAFVAEAAIINSLEHQAPSNGSNVNGNDKISNGEIDGDFDEEEERFPAIQSLKLIDFAHAEWTPGQGADENFLHGIRNVIKVLHDII
ncbi:hypothetical protein ACLMJK_003535 [Lecanora helva]